MNLYELQKEINLKRQYQNADRIKIKQLRESMLPHAMIYSDVQVQGHSTRKDYADTINSIVKLEKDIDRLEEEINEYKPIVEEIEHILKEQNDKEQQMYLEHYLKGYSILKISVRYGIGRATAYRKLKKIEENLLCETK